MCWMLIISWFKWLHRSTRQARLGELTITGYVISPNVLTSDETCPEEPFVKVFHTNRVLFNQSFYWLHCSPQIFYSRTTWSEQHGNIVFGETLFPALCTVLYVSIALSPSCTDSLSRFAVPLLETEMSVCKLQFKEKKAISLEFPFHRLSYSAGGDKNYTAVLLDAYVHDIICFFGSWKTLAMSGWGWAWTIHVCVNYFILWAWILLLTESTKRSIYLKGQKNLILMHYFYFSK